MVNFNPDLIETPNISFDVLIINNGLEDKMMNYTIKKPASCHQSNYIEHKEGSNTFTLHVYNNQQKKDELYQTVLNINNKLRDRQAYVKLLN